MPEEEKSEVWQPVVLVTDQPVMCECGKPAIFIALEGETSDFDYVALCQSCFEQEDEEED